MRRHFDPVTIPSALRTDHITPTRPSTSPRRRPPPPYSPRDDPSFHLVGNSITRSVAPFRPRESAVLHQTVIALNSSKRSVESRLKWRPSKVPSRLLVERRAAPSRTVSFLSHVLTPSQKEGVILGVPLDSLFRLERTLQRARTHDESAGAAVGGGLVSEVLHHTMHAHSFAAQRTPRAVRN
jgi:hypothetical protein